MNESADWDRVPKYTPSMSSEAEMNGLLTSVSFPPSQLRDFTSSCKAFIFQEFTTDTCAGIK